MLLCGIHAGGLIRPMLHQVVCLALDYLKMGARAVAVLPKRAGAG